MADFLTAHKLTGKSEGGYQCFREDNGNWTSGKIGVGVLIGTNHGISAPVLWAYLGKMPTVNDMKTLSYETAVGIFKRDYWAKIKGDQINSQELANIIYDNAVLSGPTSAIKKIQAELGLIQDGIMGAGTLKAINE